MFSVFAYVGERPEKRHKGETIGSAPELPLFQFARTLILRPDLALKVKTLDTSTFYYDEIDYSDEVTDEDLDILTQAVVQLGMPDAETWQESPMNFERTAGIALLNCLLPNVQAFHFTITEESLSYLESWASFASNQRAPRPAPFSSLKSLHITGFFDVFDNLNGFHLNQIGPILSLPTLEIFAVENCFWDFDFDSGTVDTFQCPAGSLKISTIALTTGVVSTACMKTLVAGCRSLEKFEETRSMQDLEYFGYDVTSCGVNGICSALHSHAASLREVRLSICETGEYILDLESCQRLKTLGLWLWLRGNCRQVEVMIIKLDIRSQKRMTPSFASIVVDTAEFRSPISDYSSDSAPPTEEETLKLYYTWKEDWLNGTDIELVFLNNSLFPDFDNSYVPSPEGLKVLQKIQDEGVTVTPTPNEGMNAS
ncbi:uncharacterized protein BDZ99DRAFT_571467 [Mytilinidion resinicola]|uniref:RNI-like protein n=1 Tax=Mytilinidion resinicola TaxID=574789 RepID=A0A6A6YMC8_9PEZI|nr:uncharacterized protein BDZ99DRAFT_571467 [Mytilinidion resinicola]KAF2809698.1 hypothetical protein BDZ99DRAFT_571467 [Mytilinidion resinicola]